MTDTPDSVEDSRWQGGRRRKSCAHCDRGVLGRRPLENRAPCPSCGATTCSPCASPCRGCALQERIEAVCAGGAALAPTAPPDERDAKTFHLVRTLGSARDVLVAPSIIAVRVVGDPRRHSYLPAAGPEVLRGVMRQTGVQRLDRPLVAHAHAGRTWRLTPAEARDEIAWLIPLARGVELRFRPPPREGLPPSPIDVPASGAWALPAAWSPPPPVRPVDVAGHGEPCPHCLVASPHYRLARPHAFICLRCGQSFENDTLRGRLSEGGN